MPRVRPQDLPQARQKYPPTTVSPQPPHAYATLPPEEEEDEEPESPPQREQPAYPDDPERQRAHNAYKIAQTNHAMAVRRFKYGDDVDAGFYGMVNPDPDSHVNTDTDEIRLMNLKEAKYHAQQYVRNRPMPACMLDFDFAH